jgi:dephospho-CoA kinase
MSFWIQKAIRRPGSLRAWLKRHQEAITRRYGESPFRRDGTIKVSVLRKLRKDDEFLKKLSKSRYGLIKRKINLAITLHKLRR